MRYSPGRRGPLTFVDSAAWDEAVSNLEDEIEGAPSSIPLPSRHRISFNASATALPPSNGASTSATTAAAGKRKAPSGRKGGKKAKLENGSAGAADAEEEEEEDAAEEGAEMADGQAGQLEAQGEPAAAAYESIFSPDELRAPKLLTAQELEKAIVQRQKAILLEEYGVEKE